MTYLQKFKKIPNNIAILGILVYQKVLSPSLGILRFLPFYPRPSCVFYPTCSEYGLICFKKYPFLKAFTKTVRRVGRCHPGTMPQIDHP